MTDKPKEGLRTGRTTGTCATAAAIAAVLFLLNDETRDQIDTPLPTGARLIVPIERIVKEQDAARAVVIKDGGDDPDATHGAEIQALVRIEAESGELKVNLEGGRGVGRATLPGLPIAPGQAAINPAPREQIIQAVRQAADGFQGTVHVLIEVPGGEEIARKTLNPRLGILGGISILGTQGIVKPYSLASWKATITESLDVARALKLETAVFTTGRRSERFYQELYPGTPEQSLIQAADFFGFSMRAAAERGMKRVEWAMFFGKLVKQAQGLEYTHARTAPTDFLLLADACREAGIAATLCAEVEGANTARHALEIINGDPRVPALLELLIGRATHHARRYAETGFPNGIHYTVFDFDGTLLR